MKVLLLNGSTHENGSTRTVLEEMAKTFASEGIATEMFNLGTTPVAACRGCGACAKLKQCVVKDDGVNAFLDLAQDCDGFVFGSPVHYAATSGCISPFLDRAFFASANSGRNVFQHKPGCGVAVARRAGTTATLDQINKYFTITQMPVISGRYWNMVFGRTPNDVVQDAEGMQNLRFVARNMAWHLKCREAGLAAGITPPVQEEVQWTSFIR